MISFLLLKQIAQLFLCMLLGFCLVRAKLLKPADSRVLSVVVLYVVMPCVIVASFQIDCTAEMLSKLPVPKLYDIEETAPAAFDNKEKLTYEINIDDDGTYVVSGNLVYKIMASTNFADNESVAFFQRSLRSTGIIDSLLAAGIEEGDTVRMLDFEFDFIN